MLGRVSRVSPGLLLVMFGCTAAMIARALLPVMGPPDGDLTYFLIPWMNEIHRLGWHSIGGWFSDYTPPYIYLLNLMAWIPDPVIAVKLANVPFVILLALGVRKLAGDIAGTVALILPSLQVNAFAFGQCDVIFTSFLVWFVVFAERGRMILAAVMFGLAFAFKAQAMFLAPVLLYLLLAKRMRWEVLLIPFTYVALMIPAAIAGRSWERLLTIYLYQPGVEQELSLNAPNPWWFVHSMDYQTGVVIGLALGALTSAAIACWAWKTRPPILLVACISAAVLPYVLPKMTSRYFFVADVLTLALAFRNPQTWPAAVLIQIGSLLAMFSYFSGVGTAPLAFLPMTMGVGFLVYLAADVEALKGNSVSERGSGGRGWAI